MRIRMKVNLSTTYSSYRRGKEYELPGDVAGPMVDAGVADPVTETAADPDPAADPVTESEPADSKPSPKKKKTK